VTENVGGNAARNLPFAHDDKARAVPRQILSLVIGVGPRDNLELWIRRPRLLDKIAAFECAGNGADQPACAGNVRRLDDPQFAGAADDDFCAFRPQLLGNFATLVDYKKRLAVF